MIEAHSPELLYLLSGAACSLAALSINRALEIR